MTSLYMAESEGLLALSLHSPFGPHCVRLNLLPANFIEPQLVLIHASAPNIFRDEYIHPSKYGGERGIRTPGAFRLNGFQDRRFRPLSQLSRNLQFIQ